MGELKEINETLKKIESKLEDKNLSRYSWMSFLDYEKIEESSRKEREEKRNEEILKLQRTQSDSMKNQENFNRVIAFTGAIIALITIYTFLVQSINFKDYPLYYGIITFIFFIFLIMCIIPLMGVILNFCKKEIFGR